MDLTYPANICLDVGPDSRNGATDPATDLLLVNSRVHDCGSAYSPPRFPTDSGVHGIYMQFLRDGADADGYSAVLRNNVIDHNHNRGLQLYPDAKNVLVTHNVLFANGANLNFGSEPGAQRLLGQQHRDRQHHRRVGAGRSGRWLCGRHGRGSSATFPSAAR